MTEVWGNGDEELTDNKLLVLLALADHANDDGICWPSLPTIAKKSRLSESQARRILKWLREKKYIEVVETGNGRKSTIYRVTPQGSHSYGTPGYSQPWTPSPVITVTPESLSEPSKEPSGSGRKRPTRAKSDAVEIFRQYTHRYPTLYQEGNIDMKVIDLRLWEDVLKEWLLRGFSPVNVKGMLEWYEKGIPNYTKKEKESERERIMREWREQDEKPGQGS